MQVAEALTQSTLSNVYEGLVSFDSEMRVVPALALSWSSPDERTWLFRLRPGVRLHDGQLMTVRDVSRALERARSDPQSRLRGRLATLERVEPADDATVRIVTTRPDPMLLNRLAYVLVVPAPGNGTGPYRIASWSAAKPLELQAFDAYWGGRPSIDRVRFVSIPDPEQRIRALRHGSVEVLRWVPEARLAEVERLPGFRVSSRAGLVAYYLWFDSRPGAGRPFADVRVRRAAALAIDRAQLVAALGGHAEALEQLVPVGVFGHVDALPRPRFDPDGARRLLAEAGYPNGFDMTLTASPGASMATLRVLVSSMLRRVGIRTRVVVPDWAQMMADLEAGRLPFYILGWRLETGEAATFLRDCLHTPAAASSGNCNPGYSNPALDRLLDESDQILEDSLRLAHYEDMMALVGDDVPVVPLYRQADYYAVSTRLRFTPRLDGKLLADDMALAQAN